MGLAGRKDKQRIGVDPRNTTWADDASRFGKAYLEKFGWSNGTGLGTNADGRTSHLKVMHKLDLMGIGANRTREGDEGGQGRDYERLLKRLNESNVPPAEDSESTPPVEDAPPATEERPKKKRKMDTPLAETESELEAEPPKQVHLPRPMAHRSKFLRSKNMAKNSQTALNEILGISSSSNTPTPTPGPATPRLTDPNSDPTSGAQTPSAGGDIDITKASEEHHLLSTATKSVADYFAEKLAARKKSTLATSTTSAVLEAITPLEAESSSSAQVGNASPPADEEEEERRRKEERKKRKKEKRAKEVDEPQPEVELPDTDKKEKKKEKKSKKKANAGEETTEASAALDSGDVGGDSESRKEKKKKKKRKAVDESPA